MSIKSRRLENGIIFWGLFFIHLFFIYRFGMRVPWDNDDIKTFMIGAFLSGRYDLSELHKFETSIQYYGPGQQLIYIPLFWIFDDLKQVFACELVINGAIASFVGVCCNNILGEVLVDCKAITRIFLSFLIGMYPPLITGTIGTNNETLLRTIPVLMLYLIFLLNQTDTLAKRIVYSMVLGGVTAYGYMLNERGIVIVVASGVYLLYDLISKKKKSSFFLCVGFVPIWYVNILLKQYILRVFFPVFRDNISLQNVVSNVSSAFGVRIKTFLDISSSQLWNFLNMSSGVLFCSLVITGGVLIFCVIGMVKKTEHRELYIFSTALLISNWTMIVIVLRTTFWNVSKSMIDYYFYERYIDLAILPALLCAIIYIESNKYDKCDKLVYLLINLFSVIHIISVYAPKFILSGAIGYRIQNISFFSMFMGDGFKSNPSVKDFWICGFLLILFCSIVVIFVMSDSRQVHFKYAFMLFIMILFVVNCEWVCKRYTPMVKLQNNRIELCQEVFNQIDKYYEEDEIYLLYDGGMWRGVNMQFALQNYKVRQVDIVDNNIKEALGFVETSSYVMIPSSYDISLYENLHKVSSFADSQTVTDKQMDFDLYIYN